MVPSLETHLEAQDDFPDKLMRVAVRRICEERNATSLTDRLSLAAELRAAAELRVLKEIGRCRASGLSWAEIGAALGVSAQAAHRRYSGKRVALDGEALLDDVVPQQSRDQ
ncbi:hypothetical protein [Streptomyces brasiliscabiei]|uniref:hypothetical protein n=1 Tax=Streptomyces brasiliscabiei TaxID=2736302 RepID=UPI001C1080E5|nr:hypothetical protein [Streptomyces brasiliscabiei]